MKYAMIAVLLILGCEADDTQRCGDGEVEMVNPFGETDCVRF